MASSTRTSSISPAFVYLSLFALAFIPLVGCLLAPFVALDDSVLVCENPMVRGEAPWYKAFTSYYYYQYTPITFISYRLNASLFGLDAAWSFRLVNWLIHAASACFLWRLLGLLGVNPRGCLFVASAWAVHPMACETVAWIAERSNAFAFFFGVVALWSYVKWHGRWQGVVWSAVAFGAALLSKPLALGWLPIFFALELLGGPSRLRGEEDFSGPPGKGRWTRWGFAAIRLLPVTTLALALLCVGLSSYQTATRPPPGGTWFTALLTDSGLFLKYAWNTMVPIGLSVMYAIHDIVSLADGRLWLNVLVWLALIGGSVALAESRRRAIFGWLWFFGGLGPACNIVAVGYPMQDRYAYLSSAGLLLVCAELAAGLAARGLFARMLGSQTPAPPAAKGEADALTAPACCALSRWTGSGRRAWVGPVLAAMYLVFLAVLSLQRAPLWGNMPGLMYQAVVREPDGALPHIFLARELEWQAREVEWNAPIVPPLARKYRQIAAAHLKEGLSKPDAYVFDPFPAILMLARNLLLTGKHQEAIELLEQSMLDPDKYRKDSQHGLRHILVPEDRHGFPYVVLLLELAEGHYWLGEAYLGKACDGPAEQSVAILDRVCLEAHRALAINPGCYEAYALLSKEYLFRGALLNDPSPANLATARGRLVVAAPQLDRMGRVPEILKTIIPPVPPERIVALGCLAMARAAREAAEFSGAADTFPQLQDSLTWAKRASDVDPAFGEAFWFQSTVYVEILRRLSHVSPEDCARMKAEAIAALKSVRAASPRYSQAQERLSSMER